MPNIGDQHVTNGAGQLVNPFEEEKPHISEFTAQEIATLSSRLEKQLGPEYISSRSGPGGKPVFYLAAEKSITLANEVFGFNGWSSSIRQIQMDFVDVSGEKVSCGLHAIVRVTLRDGTFHEDVGYGHMENAKGKAQAFEKAKKEATTDALKRALRSFGNLLGNCVYDKEYLKRVTKVKAPPTKWDVENLHRHSDFAPIKKEPESEISIRPESGTTRPQGNHEDEFGSDDFDEGDFAVPEGGDIEVADASILHQAQQMERQSSISSKPKPKAHNQESLPPTKSNRPPALIASVPGAPDHQLRTRAPSPQRFQGQGVPMTTTTPYPNLAGPHTSTTTPNLRPNRQQEQSLANPNDQPTSSSSNGIADPPIGFFTARAAETLQTNPMSAAPSFNPHLDSPSIRKTAGIDHTKTKPINRDALASAPRIGGIAPPLLHGGSIAPGGNSAFQHPGARKLGMPNNGIASPLQNRASYKPPQMVKRTAADGSSRTALGDVTNAGAVNQSLDRPDAKRLKVGVQGAENPAAGLSA